jgi:hypothetical protein
MQYILQGNQFESLGVTSLLSQKLGHLLLINN